MNYLTSPVSKYLFYSIFSCKQSNNTPSGEPVIDVGPSTSSGVTYSRPASSGSGSRTNSSIKEDEVDLQLTKLDGKIERKRDEKL